MASPVYDIIGRGYVAHRRAEPTWEAEVARHLAGCRRVVNVGAGTGSYEPDGPGHEVVSVEPSVVMIGQRSGEAAPVVRASSAALPLSDDWADAVLAVLTVHHWDDWSAGLAELCRVAPKRIVLAIDFEQHARFWLLTEYLPEVRAHTLACRPGAGVIAEAIGATATHVLEVPRAMRDGVMGAYWCRPEAYLDPAVRANCSGLALADPAVVARGIAALEADIDSGVWHDRHADLDMVESIDLGYRLIVSA
jgi:SAM-dependent methyltransferase